MAEEQPKKTIRLGDLRAASVPLEVEFGGQTITLQYRPYALDGVFEDGILGAMEAAGTQMEVYAAYRTYLPEVLAGWNLTAADDAPLPCDAEGLRAIPGPALVAWYRAIQEHLRPN